VSELLLRVASGAVLASAALATALFGGIAFAGLWAAAGAAVAYEWLALTRVEPAGPLRALAVAGVFAAGLLAGFDNAGGAVLVAGLTALAAAVAARRQGDRAWAAGGILYAAVLAIVPVLVRNLPQVGLMAILWMFAVVWATDVAGYFTGGALGGPKLWPRASPKKTWSGFVGGTLAGTAAGYVVATIFGTGIGMGWFLLLTALASIAGQAGDLGESVLKRRFGAKDSSHLIPGHGGLMDRLDGFWAVSSICGFVILARELS
jgi:phosphatidate cytidylyltransferase